MPRQASKASSKTTAKKSQKSSNANTPTRVTRGWVWLVWYLLSVLILSLYTDKLVLQRKMILRTSEQTLKIESMFPLWVLFLVMEKWHPPWRKRARQTKGTYHVSSMSEYIHLLISYWYCRFPEKPVKRKLDYEATDEDEDGVGPRWVYCRFWYQICIYLLCTLL